MFSMQGIQFHVMKRKGKCNKCSYELQPNDKSVVLGELSNKYRYCTNCFIRIIELEFNVEILDFIKEG